MASPYQPKPCPSIAAYRRHLRHGEPTCDACKKVWADYNREKRAERQDWQRKATRQ